MATTLNDICKETGLSKATISRIINDIPTVKQSTRERVLKIMARMDYHPSAAARSLAGGRTLTLGVLSPYAGSGFFSEVLIGADSVAVERGYHIMTAFGHGVTDEQGLFNRFALERRVDALILLNLDFPDRFLAAAAKQPMPFVVVGTPLHRLSIPSVSIDNRAGADQIMSHLLSLGHRNIVVFSGPAASYDSRKRLDGCRAALKKAGRTLMDADIMAGEFTIESGRILMQNLLNAPGPRPDAVMCLNDATAIGAMEVMRQNGLRAPDDISITGFDDSELAPPMGLTTARVPFRQMGREAATLALDCLSNGMSNRHIVMPAELIIRETCGAGQTTSALR